MKENLRKSVQKIVVRSFILSQGFIAMGIISHHVNGNSSVALADENKLNNQQVQIKAQDNINQKTQKNNESIRNSVNANKDNTSEYKAPVTNQFKDSSLNTLQQDQYYNRQQQSNNANMKYNETIAAPSTNNVKSIEQPKNNTKIKQTISTQSENISDKKPSMESNYKNLNTTELQNKTLTKANEQSTTRSATQSLVKANIRSSSFSNTYNEEENEIKSVKEANDERLRETKGNSTYKYTGDPTHEGVLGIETDRINYKPGDTVKIYTEHNKNFVKPIYNEAKLYSHRLGGWDITDPPYYFDQTAFIGRTTKFYKKPNGNWESLIEIKLPDNMVDDAFDLDINSWNDDYPGDSKSSLNQIVIKVRNDNSAKPLGGYDSSAFDSSSNQKLDYSKPQVVKFNTDKKIYNPNDIVTLTVEIEEESDLTYVRADMSTVEPYSYDKGTHKYIPIQFTDVTRDLILLDNGNWQAKLQFKIPDYIKTGSVQIDEILTTDNFGNDTRYDPIFEGEKINSIFKIERTENVQSFSVDTIADFSKEIRGKGTSGMTIYAYANNKKIGQATVVDGKYFMKIPKQVANTKIQIYTVNKYKNKSKIVTTTVLDKTAPKKPTISKIAPRTITGKGEKDSTIYVYKGSTKIGTGTVDSKGKYSINIRPQKKGTTLTIYAKDKSKNKSKIKIHEIFVRATRINEKEYGISDSFTLTTNNHGYINTIKDNTQDYLSFIPIHIQL